MKILLLGATGQVGDAVLPALVRSGHHVSALVRDASGHSFPKDVSVAAEPVFTRDVLRAALRDVDHVIYCLGLPEQFMFDTSVFEQANCELLTAFLDAMRETGVKGLTYLSTYEVFAALDGVIRETHPIADDRHMTPYSRSKVQAYRQVLAFARKNDIRLTSIHPGAVYGGLNTGAGITDYMQNLASWKWYRVPSITRGDFPVIHVGSLAEVITRSLGKPGSYLASDQMTSLQGIAREMRKQTSSYVPLVLPLALVKIGVALMEMVAKVARVKPLLSFVQIDFITRGWRPESQKAIAELGWKPLPLEDGIERLLGGSRLPEEKAPQAHTRAA